MTKGPDGLPQKWPASVGDPNGRMANRIAVLALVLSVVVTVVTGFSSYGDNDTEIKQRVTAIETKQVDVERRQADAERRMERIENKIDRLLELAR